MRRRAPRAQMNLPGIIPTQRRLPITVPRDENPWSTGVLARPRRTGAKGAGLTTLEICAGAGGQALGFEQAGVEHVGLVEIDKDACSTLRLNRPGWPVIEADMNCFDGRPFKGTTDILSGGLPCPPFSIAGKQLGSGDERNLFPAMIQLVDQVRPRAVVIENVRGILEAIFQDYRRYVARELTMLGYTTGWNILNASNFGVPQLRPRVIFVALRNEYSQNFSWPESAAYPPKTVGETLYDLMAANGWRGAKDWARKANEIAPTVVGGSQKHGGPDLGPTRSRRAWAALGVDGLGIGDGPPPREFIGPPRLTVRMVARLQGFPDDWQFCGRKTSAYRQVGNALPPPLAKAVALSIRNCLETSRPLRAAG